MTLAEVVPRFQFSEGAGTTVRSADVSILFCVKQRHREQWAGVDKAYPRILGLWSFSLSSIRLTGTVVSWIPRTIYMDGHTPHM